MHDHVTPKLTIHFLNNRYSDIQIINDCNETKNKSLICIHEHMTEISYRILNLSIFEVLHT